VIFPVLAFSSIVGYSDRTASIAAAYTAANVSSYLARFAAAVSAL
jgi:hypothetical protein